MKTINKERCAECNSQYYRTYDICEDQPKPCPKCGSTKISCIEEDVDYIELLESY
jgi:hypothetical protein